MGNLIKIALILFCLFSVDVRASSPLKMSFIYPGGQGSEALAQPILDQFFNLIEKQGGIKISGKYFTSENLGFGEIIKNQVNLAILSLDSYLKQKEINPKTKVLLSTIPLSTKKPLESFHLMGTQENSVSDLKNIKGIYSSRPMAKYYFQYVAMHGFPLKELSNVDLEIESNILSKLRSMANNQEKTSLALLDSYEYESIQRLNFPWVRKLKQIYANETLPSSPLVLLNEIDEDVQEKLVSTLLKLSKTDGGKEVLQMLRLKGFTTPEQKNYSNYFETWSKAKGADI